MSRSQQPLLRVLSLAALMVACGPKAAPTAAPAAPEGPPVREMPAPLPDRPFKMPAITEATLSNGLVVRVATNSEVPLWEARLLFRAGAYTDPKGKEGLTKVMMAMLDDGAAGKDAQAISRTLKKLGGSLSARGGSDSSSLTVGGPKSNLAPLLDLWTEALLQPEFPEDEWTLLQDRLVAGLVASAEEPTAIASKVLNRLAWGDAYDGRTPTAESYQGIRLQDLKVHRKNTLSPEHATLLVGGDLTLEEIVPLLEARLAKWTQAARPLQDPGAVPAATPTEATLYVVDKPGAAQSVVKAYLPVGHRTDDDYYALYMGNTAVGGAFTARVNMNLREDKGYTYGARCGFAHGLGPSIWTCSASVATDVTTPSMVELRKEITESVGDRPVTADELAFFRSYRVNAFKSAYETPSSQLGTLGSIWTYNLPGDWLETYVPTIDALTLDQVQDALNSRIDTSKISYLVVGDLAVVREDLVSLGMPIIELDRDGNPLD